MVVGIDLLTNPELLIFYILFTLLLISMELTINQQQENT